MPTTDYDHMTDEELWGSPLGQRLRHYADKLLLAEGERIQLVAKRQWEAHVRGGVERARAIVSPLGDPSPLSHGFTDEPMRPDTDPWADWQSPEVVGLREAVKATDGTIPAVQEAAKAYIASLQGQERPAAVEASGALLPGELQKLVTSKLPRADRFQTVGPVSGPGRGLTFSTGARRWHFAAPDGHISGEHDSRAEAADAFDEYTAQGPAAESEATLTDVAGALSYLLTGHAASDKGPFAVHDADGFHDEPYVLLSVDSMRRVLDRLPESTW